jgi:hypothetical protein
MLAGVATIVTETLLACQEIPFRQNSAHSVAEGVLEVVSRAASLVQLREFLYICLVLFGVAIRVFDAGANSDIFRAVKQFVRNEHAARGGM